MQLSSIYSNAPELFEAITFHCRENSHLLNVILGEVRKPSDKRRDSHNLGKTTLLQLIDFMMLKGVSPDLFLVKHLERFSRLVFYLEIGLNSGEFATIRRSVQAPNAIALTKHAQGDLKLVAQGDDEWDHTDLSLDEARSLLDAWLDLRVLKPYDYRKAITYFLRSQDDWSDELQLKKFSMGKDAQWKPFVAHLFGLNANAIQRKYEIDDDVQRLKQIQAQKQTEVQFKEEDLPGLIADISVLSQDVELLEQQLDAFRFDAEERRIMEALVNDVENEIASINNELYNIRYDINQIEIALNHRDRFDLDAIVEIFNETKLLFPEQLKAKYEDLVEFNKKVTHERNAALRARKKTLEERQREIFSRKSELDSEREKQLKLLRSTDTFEKFKELQKDLAKQRADLVYRDEQRKRLEAVVETANLVREKERERGRLVDEIKTAINRTNPVLSKFQRVFNDYCQRVLDHKGVFYFYVNTNNNLDYTIGLEMKGHSGKTSSQGDGTSYKKLICALFDLALLKVYEDAPFFHFVYHDGVLEALDNRKKLALLDVVREQITSNKTQYILTLIEADLPRRGKNSIVRFADDEFVLRLHDEGDAGRLFKMPEF